MRKLLIVLGIALGAAWACGSGDNSEGFTRHTVTEEIEGPAFAAVADMDGDGNQDIVVTNFGAISTQNPDAKGGVTLFRSDGTLDGWTRSDIVTDADDINFPNAVTLEDVNGDGLVDAIVPSGFFICAPCGGLDWFEQTADGWVRHTIVEKGTVPFFHHAELVDINGDGRKDLFTVGEEFMTSATPQFFLGDDSADRFEKVARPIGMGLGSTPVLRDIDGDGDLDAAGAEFFLSPAMKPFSFAWMEQTAAPDAANPAGVWERHVIADDVGPAIMFRFIDNLTGDGKTYGVGSVHTNETLDGIPSAVYIYPLPDGDAVTGKWTGTRISEGILSVPRTGQGAPGIFGWGDIDGDGDIDIAVSGDGDPRVFALMQTSPGVFETVVLAEDMGQAGAMQVGDLDQDGQTDIVVSSFDRNAVYVYEWE